MATSLLHKAAALTPPWLLMRLRSSKLIRDSLRRLASNRDMQIAAGVGAGLWFNAGPSNPAYALGTNEPPVQAALARWLQPGDVFYDIGANVGFFTVIGAKLVGPQGHVVAFEPAPANAACVRHNLALNHFHHVTLIEKAVSSQSGSGNLMVTAYSGGATISPADAGDDVVESIPVALIAIDDLLARQEAPPPIVVKVDVEGAELAVLHGMVQTLREYRPVVIFEVDDGNAARCQEKFEACAAFLRQRGYTVEALEASYTTAEWHVSHALATPA